MATCYLCGKSHAEYRREVKTGNSYRTGISSRGRTSFSTQSHYGPRSVCAECALQIDYNNKKHSAGAFFLNMLGGLILAGFFFFIMIFGTKGLAICIITSIVCFISAGICKKNKEAEAVRWYEANRGQYVDRIDVQTLASYSQKFAKTLEKDFNILMDKINRFKDSAKKCLVTSRNPKEFKILYENCNVVIGYIDAFIKQGKNAKWDFENNIQQEFGNKDTSKQVIDGCDAVWRNFEDSLLKEESEIQQLQKSFILDENITDSSSTSTAVSTNVPLGYKTADVFDQSFWNQQFWENVTVEQVQHSSPSGYNNTNTEGFTALFLAAMYSKNVEILKALVEKGCDVNAKDNKGITIPFYLLTEKFYNIEIIRTLLSYNFNINQVYDKETLLTQALKLCPKFELIKTLIEFGANVNETNLNNSPIEIVANKKEISIDIMRLLLNTGYEKNEIIGKNSALTYAVTIPNNKDKINLLIKFGYNVDLIINEDKATSLFAACLIHNNQENINVLIDNGANINHQISSLRTCLLESIIQQYPENAKVLIERGADFNLCDEQGISPLFAAAYFGDIENLKLLISKGANVNQVLTNGESPLSQCFKSDNAKEVLEILLKAGADITFEDKEGCSILFSALAYNKDEEIIKKLLDLGLDVNKINNSGESPLIIALEKESHPEVIRLLLINGANKNLKDKNGNTMMQLALKNPNAEIVKFFMN